MTTNYLYQYAVVRYVHDPITQEFINIGIVLYAPGSGYLHALINRNYGRLSDAFRQVNGVFYRTVVAAIDRRVAEIRQEWARGSWLVSRPADLASLLPSILPPDDSSLVIAPAGGGLASDLDEQLSHLYGRLVMRYAEKEDVPSRNDEQVWQVYQQELERMQILNQLQRVEIVASTYSMEFDHAWKNEKWHPVEAVSFDLVRPDSIADKAHRWIGHALALRDSEQLGRFYFLVGAPRRPDLLRSYENALDGMRQLIQNVTIVREEQAQEFSQQLAHMIATHAQSREGDR